MLLLIFSVMFIFFMKVIANVRWLTTRNFILVINWWTYFDAQIQISGLNRKYIQHIVYVGVVLWQIMVFSQWFKRKTKLFLVTFVKKLFEWNCINIMLFSSFTASFLVIICRITIHMSWSVQNVNTQVNVPSSARYRHHPFRKLICRWVFTDECTVEYRRKKAESSAES